MTRSDLQRRIDDCPWPGIHDELHARGAAVLPQLLDAGQRAALRESCVSGRFRNRILMERHNFGRGEPAKARYSRSIIDPCRANAVSTGSPCGTA